MITTQHKNIHTQHQIHISHDDPIPHEPISHDEFEKLERHNTDINMEMDILDCKHVLVYKSSVSA